MRLLVKMFLIISLLFIFLSSNVFADSNNSQSKSESRNQGINSENWKNHRYSFNPLYTRYREGKSNNEPFFSEPNNDQYESLPQTLQITAIPSPNGNLIPGIAGLTGQLPNQLPINIAGLNGLNGLNNLGALNQLTALNALQGSNQRPIFLINRKVDWFSWLIPLLIILGAPLILGIFFIPMALKSTLFVLQVLRNLGVLLPLTAALSGGTAAAAANTLSQATG